MIFEKPLITSSEETHEPCVYEFAEQFNRYFINKYHVRLSPGAEEPFYRAAVNTRDPAVIFSTNDYFSSALHELAHWCIAGSERRQQDDYGYWYEPDGRSEEQQAMFYKVEKKPQALEWAFSLAANIPFRISLDNLNAEHIPADDVERFREHVYQQLSDYFLNGFPSRAQQLIALLCALYRQHQPIVLPIKSSCLL